MKNVFFTMIAVLSMAFMISCDNKKESNVEVVSDSDDALSYKSIVVEKSDTAKNIEYKFVVDFPVKGPKELTDVINRNISIHMGGDSCTISQDDLNKIAGKFISESAAEIAEFSEGNDGDASVSYSFDGKIKLVENTDKYVTYYFDTYEYTGGAHGMTSKGYFTIDKSSNEVLGIKDIFVADKEDEIKNIIKKNLEEQFYKEKHDWDGMFAFDFPVQEPGITTDGLMIYYGAYEIDSYAGGIPHCIIPFKDINNLITDKVKDLIRQ